MVWIATGRVAMEMGRPAAWSPTGTTIMYPWLSNKHMPVCVCVCEREREREREREGTDLN